MRDMKWRLVDDGPASGAWNMAVDEALLLGQAAGNSPPTLRFYGWQPACLSLGRFQKLTDGQWQRLARAPVDLVRRPTGGRAVLHQHEVTYCAVFPESLLPPASRSIMGGYRWLSEGFLDGLRSLGVAADLGKADHGGGDGFNCFEAAARCDFVVDGRKLIGAAQFRHGGAVLQHGSLLLEIDRGLWSDLELAGSAVSLRELGIGGESAEIKTALKSGLTRRLDIEFCGATIDDTERAVAHSLLKSKYATLRWNRFGKFGE